MKMTLCAGQPRLIHRIGKSADVLDEFLWLNEALPTPACTTPAFSARNSTEPPFAPLTAVATSMVTLPTFGLGIGRAARVPSEPADQRHQIGRGDDAVEIDRAALHLPTGSSAPTTSAPRP